MRILVTGSEGFIGGYIVRELLEHGHSVVGLDNHSKYGPIDRSYAKHPRYLFVKGDAKDVGLMKSLLENCHHFVAGAAMIGGISYFHTYAYDLLAENERITAAAFDAAIWAHAEKQLKKIMVMSSSMVFENTTRFPTPEDEVFRCSPPSSTYGLQKLATEYFARGARSQYGLPYTIVRPFNCVGIGEGRATGSTEIRSGNVTLAMSHVLPDLIQKCVKGQDPLVILGDGQQLRHYTYGGDLARGVRMAMESPEAVDSDFNISTPDMTTVLQLAESVWRKVRGPEEPFRYITAPPFPHDVRRRSPCVDKAKLILGFEARTALDTVLDEVVPWIRAEVERGRV